MAFRLPTRIFLHSGCLHRLPGLIGSMQKKKVLLVFDEGLSSTSWPDRATGLLGQSGFIVVPFSNVEGNPRHTTVDALARFAESEDVEVVIGLGGGSVLDAAKAVSMLVPNQSTCEACEGKNQYTKAPLPFVAIPTTCGTGSEVTWVAVITQEEQKRKMSIKGESMFPQIALVDPEMLKTLSPRLVAFTGLDALTHAIEAYTGTAGNPVSDALAEKAIVLSMKYLRRAVLDIAGDHEAREAVMRASTLAGMSFGNADVAGVHCLAETIGGLWDIPHGLGNAVFLAPVLRYHLTHIGQRLSDLQTLLSPGISDSVEGRAEILLTQIEQLVFDLKIPSFRSLDIHPDSYQKIAAGAVRNNSNGSNPQVMTEFKYLEILKDL